MRTISIIFAFFLRLEVNGNLFRKPTFENLCIIEAKLENTKIDDFFSGRHSLSQIGLQLLLLLFLLLNIHVRVFYDTRQI